jgi:serine/threonine-protein kinase
VLHIVDQIASALTAVHRRGIVHRDLKPQNIFLVGGEQGTGEHVKLCDFGISKVRASSVALTGERVLLGTPQYMSPEQARGTGEVDARADQFALATIVYELLTGRLAFPGERVEVVVYRITHDDPAPLGAAWSAPLADVLWRALAKDPARRFDSVADFAAALRAAATAEGPAATAVSVSSGSRAMTTMRHLPGPAAGSGGSTTIPPAAITVSRRRAVAGGIGTLLVLAVGTAAVVLTRPRGGQAPASPTTTAAGVPRASAAAPPAPAPPPEKAVEAPAAAAAAIDTAAKTRAPKSAPPRPSAQRAPEKAQAAPDDDTPAAPPAAETKRGSLIDRL